MAADRSGAHPGPARAVAPIDHPVDVTVTVPGSKSLTNRALVCAALAEGSSTIENALVADDAGAMRSALVALGAGSGRGTADDHELQALRALLAQQTSEHADRMAQQEQQQR